MKRLDSDLERFQAELATAQGALDRAAKIVWAPRAASTQLRIARMKLQHAMNEIVQASQYADAAKELR